MTSKSALVAAYLFCIYGCAPPAVDINSQSSTIRQALAGLNLDNESDKNKAEKIITQKLKSNPEFLGEWLDVKSNATPQERYVCLRALLNQQPDQAEALIKTYLDSNVVLIRLSGVAAIKSPRTEGQQELMLQAGTDVNPRVRTASYLYLSPYDNEDVLNMMWWGLQYEKDPQVLYLLIVKFSTIEDPAVQKLVKERFSDLPTKLQEAYKAAERA